MGDVLVQRVVGPELLLELDELGRPLHEGDEEQSAEKRAAHRVDAIGERVAPSQKAGAAVLLMAGQAYVGVARDDEVPLVVCCGEVRGGELVATAQRCAGRLGPADDVLLVARTSRSQFSMKIWMRRATR